MSTFLIILFIVIVIIILLLLSYILLYNKINEIIIRVDEAEEQIDNNLRDKYDSLDKMVTSAKNVCELDEKLCKDVLMLRSKKYSNFEFDRVLTKLNNDFLVIYEGNKKIKGNEDIVKTIKNIELIDDELIVLRNYYNSNISYYNKLIKTFPMVLVAKINGYKKKLYYSLKDMSDDDYEDFKL